MFAALVLRLVLDQNPKTFHDLEIAKVMAIHELKSVRLKVRSVATQPNQPKQILQAEYSQKGGLTHCLLFMDGAQWGESVNDGETYWAVFPTKQVYFGEPVDTSQKFEPESVFVKTQGMFFFYFTGGQMLFNCDPAFQIESVAPVTVEGEKLRKVVSRSTKPSGKTMVLTQYFLPDRWILKSWEAKMAEKNGSPIEVLNGHSNLLDFHPTFDSKEFVLDSGSIAGFDRVSSPPGFSFGGIPPRS